jgi:predicted acylesterase/phospholipase RssA
MASVVGEEAIEFTRVLEEERWVLAKVWNLPPDAEFVGLAFSGGGIRSATFNLGVLRGLARLGLLPRFHYLSTVSGGGHIGAWLAKWCHQAGIEEMERAIRRSATDGGADRASSSVEPSEASFLRANSNYLTPRKGQKHLWVNRGFLLIAVALTLLLAAAVSYVCRTVG